MLTCASMDHLIIGIVCPYMVFHLPLHCVSLTSTLYFTYFYNVFHLPLHYISFTSTLYFTYFYTVFYYISVLYYIICLKIIVLYVVVGSAHSPPGSQTLGKCWQWVGNCCQANGASDGQTKLSREVCCLL